MLYVNREYWALRDMLEIRVRENIAGITLHQSAPSLCIEETAVHQLMPLPGRVSFSNILSQLS